MLLQNGLFDPSQFGQGGFGGSPMSLGGPSGFAGDMPPIGGGMFGAPQQKKPGFDPRMLMGLMGGMGLNGLMLGGLGYGLHKLGVF